MRAIQRSLIWLFTIGAFAAGYGGGNWWNFIPATGLIVATMRIFEPARYRQILGIDMTGTQLVRSIGALLLALIVGRLVIFYVIGHQSVFYTPLPSIGLFIPLFQPLNEEMICRPALIGVLKRVVTSPWLVSSIGALIFAMGHVLLYGLHGVRLQPITVLTLFFFGVVTNNLYLRTGHIGYCYAIHAGWNLTRFAGNYSQWHALEFMPEGETFNVIEGSPFVVCLALIGLILTSWPDRRRKTYNNGANDGSRKN